MRPAASIVQHAHRGSGFFRAAQQKVVESCVVSCYYSGVLISAKIEIRPIRIKENQRELSVNRSKILETKRAF